MLIITGSPVVELDLDARLDLTTTSAGKDTHEKEEEDEKQLPSGEADDQVDEDEEDETCCESFFKKRTPIFFEISQIKKMTQEDVRRLYDSPRVSDDFPITFDEQESFEEHLSRTEKEDKKRPSVWKHVQVQK